MYLNDQMLDSGALARRLLAPANNLVPVNLLTRQQASLEDAGTAGWVGTGSTIARDTTQAAVGSASLLVTMSQTASAYGAYTTIGATPVVEGRTYTAIASTRTSVGTRTLSLRIIWYNAAGTNLSNIATSYADAGTGAWATHRITGVAPAGAVSASVWVVVGAGSAGDAYYIDKVGFWEGAGGSWVNGGERLDPSTLGAYWDETVGRRRFEWDTFNNRWQMTYGDTGWRDITVENGWTNASAARIRRVGSTVFFAMSGLAGSAATSDTLYTAPSGFYPYIATRLAGVTNGGVVIQVGVGLSTGTISVSRTSLGAATMQTTLSWPTNDAWPTSLPGTASGSIPNA